MRRPLSATLALFSLFIFLPAVSTAEPTLEQTVNYINEMYKSCSPIVHKEQRSMGRDSTFTRTTINDATTISVVNGKIVMKESIRYVSAVHGRTSDSFFRETCSRGRNNLSKWARRYGTASDQCPILADKYTYTASALASNLSVEVDIKKRRLVVQCSAGKKCIKSAKKGSEENFKGERKRINKESYNPENFLPTCDNRRGKLQRAFGHLIKIMGGKKELF